MENDRITEVPENREAYENAACALTAPATIPPEAVDDDDDYDDDDYDDENEGQR